MNGTGYRIVRDAIPTTLHQAALRRLNLELRDHYSPEGYARCLRSTFFPSIRWAPEIIALQAAVEIYVEVEDGEQWADPQLLFRFPDDVTDWPIPPHVDEPPPWANGRRYRCIVGVALTRSHADDGCLAVWPPHPSVTTATPVLVELDAGDVVVMDPELPHAGSLNRGASIRTTVYFRLLTAP